MVVVNPTDVNEVGPNLEITFFFNYLERVKRHPKNCHHQWWLLGQLHLRPKTSSPQVKGKKYFTLRVAVEVVEYQRGGGRGEVSEDTVAGSADNFFLEAK